MCCDSKGDSADTGPMTAAANEAQIRADALGEAQLAEAQRQYDNNMRVATPVVEAQLGLMRQQKEQGDAFYEDYNETYRPVAQSLVRDAMDFNTADARERFARSAATDVQTQQANQEAQLARAMVATGVNPNSGRFASLSGQQRVLNAAVRAGATSNARVQADELGTSKRLTAFGLGSGLPAAALATHGAASANGTSAVGINTQVGDKLVAGTAAGTATKLAGSTQQLNGLGSVLSAETAANTAEAQAGASRSAGWGSAVGAGLGMAAMMYSGGKK